MLNKRRGNQEVAISKNFVVQIKDRNYGPLDHAGMVRFFQRKILTLHSCVYRIKEKQWSLLGELVDFTDLLPAKPQRMIEKRNIFISVGDRVSGPYSKSDIASRVSDGDLSIFDYVLIEEEGRWRCIKDLPIFLNLIPKIPTVIPVLEGPGPEQLRPNDADLDIPDLKIPPTGDEEDREVADSRDDEVEEGIENVEESGVLGEDKNLTIKNDPVWMVEKGDKTLGPYRYLEIIKMLQKNSITQNNKIRRKDEQKWRPLSDIGEFHSNIVKKISSQKDKDASKLFVQRKYKRTSYLGPATVTYNGKLYRGTCTSISEGGCFIELRPSDFQLHKEIMIKIMPGTVPLAIEARAKIVSINERSPRGIGVKFIGVNEDQAGLIRKFVEKFCR
ncbi:MAG: DUF4339 domain-containing protein [Oligoflexia bacterium]|nr:DUF4339 domain-containing protein [Oligoflexia bacterium]MBF0367357.1 DUF4339 domain-containing protein [Oligoflexia bacterium]